MNKQRAVFKMLWPEKCWHETIDGGSGGDGIWRCKHCGTRGELDSYAEDLNPDLTTWQGFGMMWEAAHLSEWWPDFKNRVNEYEIGFISKGPVFSIYRINPTRFLDALYEFGMETGRIKE